MDKKVCRNIFKDFKKRYPTLSKKVIHFAPDKGVMTIVVYLDDGTKLRYKSEEEKAYILKERWKE